MRKQPILLEHIADAAPVHRHEAPLLGIDQADAVDRDAAARRPHQAGDQIDDRALAGAGAAEQGREARSAGEARVEREAAELMVDVERQHQAPDNRRPIRRASISAASSAVIEITTEMIDKRSAPSSPPGTWVKGVDRRRQGLGLARNVRHERDGRAELAQAAREREDHAGDDPRQGQRQGDEQKHPAGRRAERARGVPRAAGRPPRSTAGSPAPSGEIP